MPDAEKKSCTFSLILQLVVYFECQNGKPNEKAVCKERSKKFGMQKEQKLQFLKWLKIKRGIDRKSLMFFNKRTLQ